MLILVHRDMNVLYVWLVSSKYMYRLQSYGKSPITSGSPLVNVYILFDKVKIIVINCYDMIRFIEGFREDWYCQLCLTLI